MTTTVIPNPRWVSLTLNFPGVGSVTRNKNIYLPIECEDRIADRLLEKFYAKLYIAPVSASSAAELITDPESNPEPKPVLESGADNSDRTGETALDRTLDAINNAQTIEELQALGLNATKASALLEATPVNLTTVSQLIPAKTLATLVAKHE